VAEPPAWAAEVVPPIGARLQKDWSFSVAEALAALLVVDRQVADPLVERPAVVETEGVGPRRAANTGDKPQVGAGIRAW